MLAFAFEMTWLWRHRQKSDNQYVKWKNYDNSFNTCIGKEDIVV